MKSRNIILTFLFVTTFSSLFATPYDDVNKHALKSFHTEFPQAQNIQWSVNGPLTKATFILNDEVLFAYYGEAGEQYALGRNIHLTQLPIKLMAEIKSTYKQYWITEAFELTKADETGYYVSIENADQKIILKTTNLTNWMVLKSSSKQ